MNCQDTSAIEKKFQGVYKQAPDWIVAVPGRTELLGNHTDHNNGRVIAAAVNTGTVAAVRVNGDEVIRVHSGGFNPVELSLRKPLPLASSEITPKQLLCGIIDGARHHDYCVGGFDAVLESTIPVGAGLSSSASYELVLISALNALFNKGEIPVVECAMIGQYAENIYCGKPCGLMDQLACAAGGITAMDFSLPKSPAVEKTDYDFEKKGYRLIVVNTGSSHADMTARYAAVADEMKAVAQIMNCKSLREVREETLLANIPFIRRGAGDRALQRAMHYFAENRRVDVAWMALKQNDIQTWLRIVNESGLSSALLLQNTYPTETYQEQPLAVALNITARFLEGDGACRVHGGGFAGTIQAYIPIGRYDAYCTLMEGIFGDDCVIPLSISEEGASVVAV